MTRAVGSLTEERQEALLIGRVVSKERSEKRGDVSHPLNSQGKIGSWDIG